MEIDEGSIQKSDIQSHSIAARVRLKNELTEDEKYRYLMRWLINRQKMENRISDT